MSTTPLTVRPDVWAQVDTATITALVNQLQEQINHTTPATGIAALVTALAFAIADVYPPAEWGPLAYDVSLHLQNTLLNELVLPAVPATQDVIDVRPEAPPIPPAPKFSAGVSPAPGADR